MDIHGGKRNPPPKRILSLDGGGVRGAVTIAFLEELERNLHRSHGRVIRLCEYFDLIGGTSTGAIIAAGLALGYSATQMRLFYETLAPRVFRRPFWRVLGLQSKFDSRHLLSELDSIVGDRTLETPDLKTHLAIVTKRLDTGSPWVLTNIPASKFWETPPDDSFIGNRHLLLKQVIRASAAAPHYFDPQFIQICKGTNPGIFVDGGVTPFNNPSLLLLQVATLPQYGLNFEATAETLEFVSVGTGSFRERWEGTPGRLQPAFALAVHALTSQIADAQHQTLTTMSWLGRCKTRWEINSELGDLGGVAGPCAPLFSFERYDIRLEEDWIYKELGEQYSKASIRLLREMDNPDVIPKLYMLAQRAASIQFERSRPALPQTR